MISPHLREQELRGFLGGFNFPGEMALNPITHFSCGEKARLALAQFEGTLVLVSHDRHLLRATTDEFLIVSEGELQPFDGDMDDYRDWLFKTKLAAEREAAATA